VSRVLVVVRNLLLHICFCCLSSSPKLLLGFGLDLPSGGVSTSKDQPQRFTLSLGSGVVSYHLLKVQILGGSGFRVAAGTSRNLCSGPNCRNFRLSLTFAFEFMYKFFRYIYSPL
jgi:hypothetical protein